MYMSSSTELAIATPVGVQPDVPSINCSQNATMKPAAPISSISGRFSLVRSLPLNMTYAAITGSGTDAIAAPSHAVASMPPSRAKNRETANRTTEAPTAGKINSDLYFASGTTTEPVLVFLKLTADSAGRYILRRYSPPTS